MSVGCARRVHPVDSRGFQCPAVAGGFGLIGGQLPTRKRQQASLVERVGQPGVLCKGVERAGLVEPESANTSTPQRGQMASDAKGGADIAGQRPDVRAARAVHLDVHIDHVG